MKTFCRIICLLLLWESFSFGAEQPNIVLAVVDDDMGFSDLGCYGGEIETPNLDGLAENGLRFTQFYNTARCWPTRCALMTGYYPQQIRMDPVCRGTLLPDWAPTVPHSLKPAGHRCYHSGKWHVNGAPKVVADGGFDRSYAALILALHQSGTNRLKEKIKIGQAFCSKKSGGLGVGNCTAGCKRHVPGCPPTASEIIKMLEG